MVSIIVRAFIVHSLFYLLKLMTEKIINVCINIICIVVSRNYKLIIYWPALSQSQ